MTEWHARYGGPGVMIYWHVERKSVCVYSQLKTCSSSEVTAMMEGLIRHSADVDSQITANYTDTHGASVVGFAFTHLLGYRLLPRLKNIGAARLYRPTDGASYPGLEPVLWSAWGKDWTPEATPESVLAELDCDLCPGVTVLLPTAPADRATRRGGRP